MIILIDFGSQTTHLISRRLKELGAKVEIVEPESALKIIQNSPSPLTGEGRGEGVDGIILSGGPSSVYEKGAPTIDGKIFDLKIPILGICYGVQLMCYLLGGKVKPAKKREYGPAELKISNLKFKISSGLSKDFTVWMSHGDEVLKVPSGFEIIGSTEHVPPAFIQNLQKNIYGILFHPEVEHTENGTQVLQNFMNICGITGSKTQINIPEILEKIKTQVGESFVIGAVSGGVDSTVAATLTARAIGSKLIPIYVDNGLMRVGTTEHVKKIFAKSKTRVQIIDVQKVMLQRLKGVTDSEQKRKIIGKLYVEVFETEMKKLIKSGKDVKFLLQGTIYSDVIESQGTKHSAKIKSHHNVGGLPKDMKLKLLEPVREFYKDEVRKIGKVLGLPEEFVQKQPFPGPGYGVRIRGEVTIKRLEQEKQADLIVLEELEKADVLKDVFLSFPVMTGAFSTAVKGDGRDFDEVVALRIIESKDIMTTTWSRLPYDLLQKISSRIVNEVPDVSRVVYDITTKPPATMEWE